MKTVNLLGSALFSSVLCGVLSALPGCSLSTFEQNACESDEDCEGVGVSCLDNGYCEAPSTRAKPNLKVGMLYVGPVGDHGWTKTHDDSRIFAAGQLDNVEFDFLPSVSKADALDRINDFIADGANVIVGTSFDFLLPIQQAALTYPDVNFLLTSGFSSGKNLGSYFGRMYQVMFQAGVLAGEMTTTDSIGIVGPVIIPETVRHVNAFTQGVRSVNANATVTIEWARAWFDPEAEEAATNALLTSGVDIIFGHTDTTIPIEVANQYYLDNNKDVKGKPQIFTIGYDNPDACTLKPELAETCIASAYWNWGPLLTQLLGDMQLGTWNPKDLPWQQMGGNPDTSTAYLSEMSLELVPSSTRLQVEALVSDLSAKTEDALYLPFQGPVSDNTDAIRITATEVATDELLLRMCWFVKGVINTDGEPAVVPSECIGDR